MDVGSSVKMGVACAGVVGGAVVGITGVTSLSVAVGVAVSLAPPPQLAASKAPTINIMGHNEPVRMPIIIETRFVEASYTNPGRVAQLLALTTLPG